MLTLKMILRFLFITVVLLTGACTTISTPKSPLTPTNQPQIQWQAYQKNLTSLNHWQASGVIGIIIDQRGESANFIWKQNNDDFWIQIYGPLGMGATIFSGNQQQVKLVRSDGETIQAHDLKSLMQSQLGWSLPLDGLYYWARGLFIPQLPYQNTFNDYGLIKTLSQQGWEIQYSHYMLYDAKYPLAEKMIFRYGDGLKITLIIKSWLLNP